MAGTVQIVTNMPSPATGVSQSTSITVTLGSPIGTVAQLNLTTTPTAVVIPSGATYILIQPPVGNTTALSIGGTGVALGAMGTLHPNVAQAIAVPTATTPVILLACASGTVSAVSVAFY